MKKNSDVAQDWLKKAESEFATVELCINNVTGLDAACFHAQQAAEKSLKAWLINHDNPFPKTHNLEELLGLCAALEPEFKNFLSEAQSLEPYAVKERYAADFWPSLDETRIALEQARRIYDCVKSHWDK